MDFNEAYLKEFRRSMGEKQLLVLKFTADWCGPCQGIAPICNRYKEQLPKSIFYYEVDVDESIDLYVKLKKYKMVNGIPALLAYLPMKSDSDDIWYVPIISHLGGDIKGVEKFFESCISLVK